MHKSTYTYRDTYIWYMHVTCVFKYEAQVYPSPLIWGHHFLCSIKIMI